VRVSSTRRTRGTRALPPASWAEDRPSLSAALAEKWSQYRETQVALPFTVRDEDEHRVGRALTSFAITVVIVLFITVVVPTIIGLVRNF